MSGETMVLSQEANLNNELAKTVFGQYRAIQKLTAHFQQWQSEPSPRFPLCLLLTGPSGTGKEHLGRALANACFDGRIARHPMWHEGPLRKNLSLAEHRGTPAVLFVKMFNEGGQDLAVLDTLLSSGGIVLGNGDTMHLADWVVMLSASEVYSAALAAAVRSDPENGLKTELFKQFPWIVGALDGVVQLDPLAPEALAEIAHFTARRISLDHSVPLGLTERAAETIALTENARSMDEPIRLAVAKSGLLPEEREQLATRDQALIIDYADGQFRTTVSKTSDVPVWTRQVDIPSPIPAPAFHITPRSRPASFPALDWRTEHRFDAFISYKFRKHQKPAEYLFDALKAMSYKIWFDADEIGTPQSREIEWSKEQLIQRLVEGVGRSRATVAFEATLEAIAVPPDYTEEQAEAEALARGHVMYADFGVVAWNWQKLEIDSSSCLITIREEAGGFAVLKDNQRVTHPTLGIGPFPFEKIPALVAKSLGSRLDLSGA